MSQERFVCEIISRYPNGSLRLETEFWDLKRKLDIDEFSEIDEEEYCKLVDSIGKESRKKARRSAIENDSRKKARSSVTVYECNICSKSFNRKPNLTRHVLSHNCTYKCDICHKQYRRKDYLQGHMKKQHKENCGIKFKCKHCDQEFTTYNDLFSTCFEKSPSELYANRW